MTPEEEREHQSFMDKINDVLKKIYGQHGGMHQPTPEPHRAPYPIDPDTPDNLLGEVDLATGEVAYYETPTTPPTHLDSIPVSPPAVRADTKRVPDNLRDMVEGS